MRKMKNPDQIIKTTRKTISLQLMPDGQLIVRCPRNMPEEEIFKFVRSKQGWINNHLARLPKEGLPTLTEPEILQLREQTRQLVQQRLRLFAPLIGVDYGRISVRAQHTRWGSCSTKGNLNFNCLLALMPPQVQDYVIVHELCHRKQMNHSPQFWALVEKMLPDYRQHRKWLKENGGRLIARLPK